jgi:hypothetical protein
MTPITSTEAVAKWLAKNNYASPLGDSDMYAALDLKKHLATLGFKIEPDVNLHNKKGPAD